MVKLFNLFHKQIYFCWDDQPFDGVFWILPSIKVVNHKSFRRIYLEWLKWSVYIHIF